ncbi:MAG: hypothetical protein JWN64_386 [Parcubacteria group bacterium]|nr:hypothetical protein [Parcubacteria group bacterium]
MRQSIALALILFLAAPFAASASELQAKRTLVVSETPATNAYLLGTDITVVAPLKADVIAAGATVTINNSVAGDVLAVGGTVDVKKPVLGDVRAVGGRIIIEDTVAGDLMLAGGSITASTTASDTHVVGGSINLNGSGGPVYAYGADIVLSGTFNGDVDVVASDRLTLAEGTVINGVLKYNAPQQAEIPDSSMVHGGVTYTGSSSYLPTVEEAKTFAIAGAGVFFVVRVIAALVAAGLVGGLFPIFAERVADRALGRSLRSFILLALLGFGVCVATPVFIILLLVSFVGMGVAILLAAIYVLLLIAGYLYAGILAGAALYRGVLKRERLTWQSAVLGMLVLYLVGVIPGMGLAVTLVLSFAAIGTIITIAYNFAFAKEEVDMTLP